MAAGGDHDQTPSAAFLVPSTRRPVGMTGRVGVGVAPRQILHHFVPKQSGTDCNRCSQRELSGTPRVPTGADGDPGGEERLMGLRTRRASPGADVGRGEPSPGADVAVAGVSLVPVQMCHGAAGERVALAVRKHSRRLRPQVSATGRHAQHHRHGARQRVSTPCSAQRSVSARA